MNLTLLSDQDLHERTLQSAATEKSATLALLEHLAEVDERMLYAKRGYSSLWEYVHLALGYSESQASERVSSMRLMRKIPEVKKAIESGTMTLTATSKLATFLKREKPNQEATAAIVKGCEQKTTRQVEKILLSHTTQPETLPFSLNAERITPVSDSLSKVQFTADEELMNLIERAKELSSKVSNGLEMRELMKAALKEYIQKREVKIAPQKNTSNDMPTSSLGSEKKIDQPTSLQAPEVSTGTATHAQNQIRNGCLIARGTRPSRYIAQSVKVTVRSRAQDQCEYIDPATQRRCSQKSHLEFDHIYPFAKGGSSTTKNIRYLCRVHNRLHAVQSYGKKKIAKYTQR